LPLRHSGKYIVGDPFIYGLLGCEWNTYVCRPWIPVPKVRELIWGTSQQSFRNMEIVLFLMLVTVSSHIC
jgi:hypothetical protein